VSSAFAQSAVRLLLAVLIVFSAIDTAGAPFLKDEPPDVAGFILSLDEITTYSTLETEQKEIALKSAAAFFAAMFCRLPDKEGRIRQWIGFDTSPNEKTKKLHRFQEARLAIIGRFLAQAGGYHKTKLTCGVAAQISNLSTDSLPD
jgi:hypothetical protein